MDWEGLIDFSVNIRQIRDESEAYQKTMQAKYLPNIYTEKYAAEAAKDLRIKELYEKEIARGQMSIVENVSDIEVNILEIEAEKLVNIELGGYCE